MRQHKKIISLLIVLMMSIQLAMPVLATDSAEPKAQWVKDSVGWWYKNADGTYPHGCWKEIDDEWYYFNNSGYRVTDWKAINGTWYYFDKDGIMASDEWIGNYYLTASGAMATGWKQIENEWYYFNASGAKTVGWKLDAGRWYYLDKDGTMATGWKAVGGTWYYLNASGAMATGWNKIDGQWYYFNTGGAMTTGWQAISGKWYYMNIDGTMATGWITSGGAWYYLNASGSMESSKWIGDYYVDQSGKMLTDTWVDGYYIDESGKCVYDKWYSIHIGNGQYTWVYGHFDDNYANQVIQQVNVYRVANGKGELEVHDALKNAAYIRGVEITHTWSHTRPDGSSCFTAIEEDFWSKGENVAMGQTTPTDVMTAWKNSPGHNENMLEDHYTYIGVSCFRAKIGNSYRNYWVQVFGRKY